MYIDYIAIDKRYSIVDEITENEFYWGKMQRHSPIIYNSNNFQYKIAQNL